MKRIFLLYSCLWTSHTDSKAHFLNVASILQANKSCKNRKLWKLKQYQTEGGYEIAAILASYVAKCVGCNSLVAMSDATWRMSNILWWKMAMHCIFAILFMQCNYIIYFCIYYAHKLSALTICVCVCVRLLVVITCALLLNNLHVFANKKIIRNSKLQSHASAGNSLWICGTFTLHERSKRSRGHTLSLQATGIYGVHAKVCVRMCVRLARLADMCALNYHHSCAYVYVLACIFKTQLL